MSEIGSPGLARVDLTIPQGTTLRFTISHTDGDGNPVDHTGSTIAAVVQGRDGRTLCNLSPYCTGTETGIDVSIPASVGNALAAGEVNRWDMIVTMSGGDTVRIAYGSATAVDTYALDEGE